VRFKASSVWHKYLDIASRNPGELKKTMTKISFVIDSTFLVVTTVFAVIALNDFLREQGVCHSNDGIKIVGKRNFLYAMFGIGFFLKFVLFLLKWFFSSISGRSDIQKTFSFFCIFSLNYCAIMLQVVLQDPNTCKSLSPHISNNFAIFCSMVMGIFYTLSFLTLTIAFLITKFSVRKARTLERMRTTIKLTIKIVFYACELFFDTICLLAIFSVVNKKRLGLIYAELSSFTYYLIVAVSVTLYKRFNRPNS